MESTQKKALNRRNLVSVGLCCSLIALVVTAIIIQIFEALENDFWLHIFNVTHIFSGFLFTILSVFHIKMNWQSIVLYIKPDGLTVSREAMYAFLLTMLTIAAAIFFVCFIMD